MQRRFLKIAAVALLTNLAAYGQSLGEIAREYREKQNAEQASGATPKTQPKMGTGEAAGVGNGCMLAICLENKQKHDQK